MFENGSLRPVEGQAGGGNPVAQARELQFSDRRADAGDGHVQTVAGKRRAVGEAQDAVLLNRRAAVGEERHAVKSREVAGDSRAVGMDIAAANRDPVGQVEGFAGGDCSAVEERPGTVVNRLIVQSQVRGGQVRASGQGDIGIPGVAHETQGRACGRGDVAGDAVSYAVNVEGRIVQVYRRGQARSDEFESAVGQLQRGEGERAAVLAGRLPVERGGVGRAGDGSGRVVRQVEPVDSVIPILVGRGVREGEIVGAGGRRKKRTKEAQRGGRKNGARNGAHHRDFLLPRGDNVTDIK